MKLEIEISSVLLVEAAQLVYNKWAAEFDLLKRVKAEVDDGSKDWKELHALRLRNHIRHEATWKALVNESAALLRKHTPGLMGTEPSESHSHD